MQFLLEDLLSPYTNRRVLTMASKAEKDVVVSRQDKEGRSKVLDAAISQVSRQFGKGALMRMGDSPRLEVEVIPSGALTLDLALGIGGIPKGRITEIYGPESSGKTTVALHAVAEAQKAGGVAAFIDVEHALDPAYARIIGVDVDQLLISQPSTGEEALEIVDILVRSGAVDIIVIDSVAALVPRAEIEGDMGDAHVGLQARLMSQALRKLTGSISKSSTSIIFINQIRMKIGVMFGNPETTSGGNALKFYASVRLEIRRGEVIKLGEEIVGNKVKIKVAKNKVAPPFRKAEFDIIYGEGISKAGCLIDCATQIGLIDKAGSWYSYGDRRLGQGKENTRILLRDDKSLFDEIETKVLKHYKIGKYAEVITEVPSVTDIESAAG
jgi:recombination protein RecA